ncbi:DUF6232 family protein [Streptomyces sp. NPDC058914]|uniref:DUF6232 family protein n=1 Tax=Streptomyces TaxID=1883 RepID=UPI0036AEF09C
MHLRVSKRLLWIGTAAYPLHNIARVYTLTLRPKRKDAVMRFLKRAAAVTAVAIVLMLPGLPAYIVSEGRSGTGTYMTFVWIAALGAGIYFLIEMISVLNAPSQYVLAVETSGASTAVVTSQNPQHLDQLVGYISHAIEHPETEFQVTVERITLSPNHYYFGDNVNMYGGNGNVGIAA